MKKGPILVVLILCVLFTRIHAQNFVVDSMGINTFSLQNANIYTDEEDDWLVNKSAELLQQDIESVTGQKLEIVHDNINSKNNFIVIGTLKSSFFIKQLIQSGKINIAPIQNKWDSYSIQAIQLNANSKGLVIIGNDKRGAAFGTFELSKQIGVSPWYWWADVPVKKKKEIFIQQNISITDAPSVKYRGIFLNDEAPALSGWVHEKFGGFNHQFYEKVFELLLRLKANYLWPAMWGSAFNNDDTLNPIMAQKYGIVMGTSHQEPMNQATEHWRHENKGAWDYQTNDSTLRDFWKKGIENMDHRETIVTIGMRGDGDEPMTEGSNIALLEKIVKDQRTIIASVTGKPASETPQDWALYKEVQDYYDKGMKVPDDVTLLFSDDNWGNLRRLPNINTKPRSGGYGIYYHFDYVGGPRNYKWLNTNNIARVWEQMHLAYAHNVKNIWIVNVGDLKPMEFPINFFLDYAWNVKDWNEDNIQDYYTQWAATQFGSEHAKEIGEIIQKYTQYNARRKPELLNENTYNILDYNESNRVRDQYDQLAKEAEKINDELPKEYRNAFFELVLHPVKACANLQDLYTAVAWNHYYAKFKNPLANRYADEAKQFYINDSLISATYNHLDNGKWNHMMDQTHIGYTYWQEPRHQKMPEVTYVANNSKGQKLKSRNNRIHSAKSLIPKNSKGNLFYEKNGYVSMEAANYTKKVDAGNIQWKVIHGIGRDGDGITTFPVTAARQDISPKSPHLEYDFYSYNSGSLKLETYFSPTLNFQHDSTGLQFAVSIDGEQPQIVSLNKQDANESIWSKWVSNDIIIKETNHSIKKPGKHTIRFWRISPAVVLQKIVVDFGGVEQSYLGPPETLAK